MIFYPTYFIDKVTNINPDFLKSRKIKGVILDIDDTLVEHGMPDPKKEVILWIDSLKSKEIKAILLSNNFKKRVKPFAKKLSLPFISAAVKPLTIGIKKAVRKLSCTPSETIIIGDQIFTDILAANLFKIKSVLVEPISKNKSLFLRSKRFLEKNIRKKITSNQNLNLENIKINYSDGNKLWGKKV